MGCEVGGSVVTPGPGRPHTHLSAEQHGGTTHLAESFSGRFRDKFLNTELFTTAPETQLLADRWRWEYKTFRPHSAFQGHTPLEAAQPGAAA